MQTNDYVPPLVDPRAPGEWPRISQKPDPRFSAIEISAHTTFPREQPDLIRLGQLLPSTAPPLLRGMGSLWLGTRLAGSQM